MKLTFCINLPTHALMSLTQRGIAFVVLFVLSKKKTKFVQFLKMNKTLLKLSTYFSYAKLGPNITEKSLFKIFSAKYSHSNRIRLNRLFRNTFVAEATITFHTVKHFKS